jgi:hypothetical protein
MTDAKTGMLIGSIITLSITVFIELLIVNALRKKNAALLEKLNDEATIAKVKSLSQSDADALLASNLGEGK